MLLNFRSANLDDVHEINNLVNSAYRGESSKAGWTTEADLLGGQRSDLEEIEEILAAPDQDLLVCTNASGIIGTVVVHKKETHAYIGMLTVKPNLQNAGVGKQILTFAENYISTEWGLAIIEMAVIRQRTELINWYMRRGYLPTGESMPFPYDDPRFGIPKTSDLEFIALQKVIEKRHHSIAYV